MFLKPSAFNTAERIDMALGTKVLMLRFGYKNNIFNFFAAFLDLVIDEKSLALSRKFLFGYYCSIY
jgi:hypothetical protein